jgi:hypothetical protein
VFDENGEEVGVSKKAGQIAVFKTIISRLILVFPILFVPPGKSILSPLFDSLSLVESWIKN